MMVIILYGLMILVCFYIMSLTTTPPVPFIPLLITCAKEFLPIALLFGIFGLVMGFMAYLGFGSAGIHLAIFASLFGVLMAFVRMMCVVFDQ